MKAIVTLFFLNGDQPKVYDNVQMKNIYFSDVGVYIGNTDIYYELVKIKSISVTVSQQF